MFSSTFKLEPGLETRIAVQKTIDDSDSQVAACSEAVSTIDTTNWYISFDSDNFSRHV